MASEAGGGRADAGGLEFDVSSDEFVEMHGVIGASKAAGQGRFAGADDLPTEHCGHARHEVLEWAAHLVFRLAGSELRHLGRDGGGESLQGFVDRDLARHAIIAFQRPKYGIRCGSVLAQRPWKSLPTGIRRGTAGPC